MMASSHRVVVAMSGGVDSTVAALLLRNQGYQVEGMYMSNWDEQDEHGHGCSLSNEDYESVIETCRHLGIRCSKAEFIKEYWTDVFSAFLQDIQRGFTPNPDVLCNRFIKFGSFRKHVWERMGATKMATGHYARVCTRENGDVQLLKSFDVAKDQTYFLSTVSQESLKDAVFPIGHMTKDRVREIAREHNLLKTLQRKESMGLCFIGKRRFPSFLKEYIEDRPGVFVSHDGHVIGEHTGHHNYTIGQRARIGGQREAWFVSRKDAVKNIVTVVEGSENPLLYSKRFKIGPAHWIRRGLAPGESKTLEGRYRHQQKLITLNVTSLEDGLIITSIEPLRAVTPGQYVVLYEGDECLGGACINEVWSLDM